MQATVFRLFDEFVILFFIANPKACENYKCLDDWKTKKCKKIKRKNRCNAKEATMENCKRTCGYCD